MNVSALVQVRPLTEIQARPLLQEIVDGLRRVDSNLTALRRKCLLFQQGEGWKPLGYASQKDCLYKVFGFSEQRFFQLTAAAEIEKDIRIDSTTVESLPTEGALRPLKKVDPAQRAEVFQEAVRLAQRDKRNDKKPVVTVRHTTAAVKTVVNLAAGNGQQPSEQVILPRDGKGHAVEEPQLREVFEARAEVQSILSGLAPFAKRIQAVLDGAAGSAYVRSGPKLAMAGLRHAIKQGCPYVPCPHCKGPGCEECEGRGWWTQAEYTAEAKAK